MIFLIGEQEGKNLGNNGFYFWKNALKKVEAYFVIHPQSQNHPILDDLTEMEKEHLIIMDSRKHLEVFNQASMLFVTLSFKDVMPSTVRLEEINQPLIYLQHGTLGIKKIYYTESSYYSHIHKFLYYNKSVSDQLIESNFEDYQLKYCPAQPRYEGLLNKNVETLENSILFFFTWRDNGDVTSIYKMLDEIEKSHSNKKCTVILHDFIEISSEKTYSFDIYKASQVDVQEELCKCEYFITDYSSVIWDAVAVEKKCLLWWNDFSDVSTDREFYITEKDVTNILGNTFTDILRLIEAPYVQDNYFYNGLQFDHQLAKVGVYTSQLVEYFIEKIKNKVSILGYNFYGSGGTVTASKALAYGYLKNDYLVEMMSMTRTTLDKLPLPGCVMKSIVDWRNRDLTFNISNKFESSTDFQLDYEYNKFNYNDITEKKLNYYLANSNFGMLISTREILHLIVKKYESIHNIKYMFHTDYSFFKEQNPELHDRFINEEFSNGIFLTPKARDEYINNLNITFKHTKIVPNGLFTPVRKRYNKKPDYKVTITDMKLKDDRLFIGAEARTNFEYINQSSIEQVNLEIGQSVYPLSIIKSDEKYPSVVNLESTEPININMLLGQNDIAFQLQINGQGHRLTPDDISIEYPKYKIIDSICIKNGKINTIQSFMMVVETEPEYSVFKINSSLNYENPIFENYIYEEEHHVLIKSENYDSPFIVSSFNTECQITVNQLNLLKQEDPQRLDICSVVRVSKDRREQLEEYLKLAKYLKNQKSNIFINIFGDGDLLEEMKEKAEKDGLETNLEFRGFSKNIQKDTANFDTQVSLSRKESFGMTYLEALAAGKRIFTYRNIGSEEMFGNYDKVFIEDYADLINKIQEENSMYFSQMREDIYSKYDINTIINQI